MNTRTLIAIIYSVSLAATGVWLLLEHRACAHILQENTALFRRLNEATDPLAENQRLPGGTAPSTGNSSLVGAPVAVSPTMTDQESLRARSELAGLVQQHQQAESLREDTRQTLAALESR